MSSEENLLPFGGVFRTLLLLWIFFEGVFHCPGCVVSHAGLTWE